MLIGLRPSPTQVPSWPDTNNIALSDGKGRLRTDLGERPSARSSVR